jgi:hypothetical protein
MTTSGKSSIIASGALLQVHDAIVKVNPKITENIAKTKEQNIIQKQTAQAIENSTNFLHRADPIYAGFGDTLENLKKKFLALHDAVKPAVLTQGVLNFREQFNKTFVTNPTAKTTLFDLPALKEEIAAVEAEEDAIAKLGASYGITSDKFKKFLKNGKDDTAMMNEMVAMSVNYTKALDDQILNQQLVSKAFLDGMIEAQDYFENLVKGTEQEGVFNDALADGAKALGIKSNLLAFSSGKMKQLINDTYEQTQAYDKEALAVSKSTAFLKDQVLIRGQVNKGMIDGARAANDWAISNVKATAEGFAFHDQLLKITADMLGLPIPINASDEALKKAQTTFQQTFDAGLALAEMMTDKLAPSFDRVSSIIQSKDMKELRDNLKKMELPKGFNKDLDDAFKPLRGAAENARKVGNAMDILVTAGANMSKKDLAGNMKAFGKELDKMSKIKGTSAPIDAILNSLKTMSPEELSQHTDSMQFLVDTINKFGSLPKDKAKEFIDMYNKEVPKIGPASTTAATGVDKLTSAWSSLVVAGSAVEKQLQRAESLFDPSKFVPSTKAKNTFVDPSFQNKTQKTTLELDTKPANAALSALIKRIDTISNMQPAPQLNTKPANSALSALIKRIDTIDNMKPAPKLNTKPANSALSSLIKRIDSIDNMKPALHLNQKPAQNAISDVIRRINSISNMHPTVKVKFTGSGTLKATGSAQLSGGGSIKIAQRGMHEFLTKDTSIFAHAGERVDIGKPEPGKDDRALKKGGDMIVENHIHVMDQEIVRKFKAQQGTGRYNFG